MPEENQSKLNLSVLPLSKTTIFAIVAIALVVLVSGYSVFVAGRNAYKSEPTTPVSSPSSVLSGSSGAGSPSPGSPKSPNGNSSKPMATGQTGGTHPTLAVPTTNIPTFTPWPTYAYPSFTPIPTSPESISTTPALTPVPFQVDGGQGVGQESYGACGYGPYHNCKQGNTITFGVTMSLSLKYCEGTYEFGGTTYQLGATISGTKCTFSFTPSQSGQYEIVGFTVTANTVDAPSSQLSMASIGFTNVITVSQ